MYGEQIGHFTLGSENGVGLAGKWNYNGWPQGPSIYRSNNLRAYGLHEGSVVLAAQGQGLQIDASSLIVGIIIGALAYPFMKDLFRKK